MLQPLQSYQTIFKKSPEKSRNDYLEMIPSEVVLIFLGFINHCLHIGKSQKEIYSIISQSWEPDLKKDVNSKIRNSASQKGVSIYLFSQWSITENIIFEIQNYRKPTSVPEGLLDQKRGTTHYRLFISHLLFTDRILEDQNRKINSIKGSKQINTTSDFVETMWPIILPQHEFSVKKDYMFEALKSNALLSQLRKIYSDQNYVEDYLGSYGYKDTWSFVSTFLNSITPKKPIKDEVRQPIISLPNYAPYLKLLERRSLQPSDFENPNSSSFGFTDLKKQPLLKYGHDKLFVLNWSFFFSQIYTGVLFDFHAFSKMPQSFPVYKSIVGKKVSEEFLFKAIISTLFDKKHVVTEFPDTPEAPDAYVRDGKYLYIFEFKDSMLSDEISNSYDYQQIVTHIDHKFVESQTGRPKGVRQLANTINSLNEEEFPFDLYSKRHIKQRNLVVCPILVFDSLQYTFPGVNLYLDEKFRDYTDDTGFQTVLPLTMMSLHYLYRNIAYLERNKLVNLLKSYHKKINMRKKSSFEPSDPQSWLLKYRSIENTNLGIKRDAVRKSPAFRKKYFSLLEKLQTP